MGEALKEGINSINWCLLTSFFSVRTVSNGLNGQAKRAKRDHNHKEIGCHKGKCVNIFVADCRLF